MSHIRSFCLVPGIQQEGTMFRCIEALDANGGVVDELRVPIDWNDIAVEDLVDVGEKTAQAIVDRLNHAINAQSTRVPIILENGLAMGCDSDELEDGTARRGVLMEHGIVREVERTQLENGVYFEVDDLSDVDDLDLGYSGDELAAEFRNYHDPLTSRRGNALP